MTDWMDSYNTSSSSGAVAQPPAAPPPSPPTEPVSQGDWMDGYRPPPNTDLSLKVGQDIPQDKAADVLKLKDQTGLPTHVISDNLEDVKDRQAQQSLSPQFVEDHPKTADLVGSDPHWASLLRDDIPTMGYMEKQLDYLSNASERSLLELERTYYGLKGAAGLGGPDNMDRVNEIDNQLENQFKPPEGASSTTQLFGKAAEVTPTYGVPLALGAMGGTTGAVGMAAAFGGMETANAYLDFKKMRDMEGNPIHDDLARGAALVSGALTSALSFIPGLGRAAEEMPALKMLQREGMNGILESPTLRGSVEDLLKKIGTSSLKMGTFAGGSALGHVASGELAKLQSDGTLETMSPGAILRSIFTPENLSHVAKMTAGGMAVGGTIEAGLGGWKVWADYSKANEAMNTQTAWTNVGNAMKSMKSFDMAPEQVGKVMDRLAGDGHVYIPLQKWQEWAETQKTDPRAAWNQAMGNTKAYDEALKTGVDLQMPSKVYASQIAPSDHNDFFSKVLRANPQAMNGEEAEGFLGKQSPEQEAKRSALYKIHEDVAPTPEPTPTAKTPETIAMTVPEPLPAQETQPITPAPKAPQTPQEIEAEQHLEAARQDLGHKPLNLEGLGMSEAQMKTIQEAEVRSRNAAQEQMARAIMDKQMKQKSKEWNLERSYVQKDIEQKAIALPEYKTLNFLQGKLPIGDVQPFKLSHADVLEHDPNYKVIDYTDTMPRGYPPGITTQSGGVDVDEAARILGFSSGDELLYKLKSIPKFEDYVNAETDKRMLETNPDVASETNLPEAAIRAVNNEQRGQLLRKQLQHLYTEEFAAAKGLTAKLVGRVPSTADLKADVDKDIGTKNYRELQPSLYLQGMRYAQNDAEQHLKAGDLQKLIDAKRAELRNFEMYRAAQKARDDIESRMDKIKDYGKKPTQEMLGKAGGTYQEDVNKLLNNPEFVQGYKGMKYDDLTNYLDQIDSLVHQAREQNKLYAVQKFEKVDDYRSALIEQLGKDFKLTENELGYPKPRITDSKPFLPETQASLTRMEFLFDHYDNWKPAGLAKQGFSDPVAQARAHEGELVQKHLFDLPKVNLNDLVEAIPFSERALWYAKLHYIPEIGMSLLKPNMLQIASYRANDYTWKALLDAYGWTDAQGMSVISRLSSKELDLVDGMPKNFEALRKELFDKYKQIHGTTPNAVQASPYEVTLKDGTTRKMEGGYMPLTFDNELSLGGTTDDMFEKNWFTAKPSDANLRNRTNPNGKAPSINFNNNLRVLGKMIHWVSFVDPLTDAGKIVSDKTIASHMIAALGKDNFDLIRPWMQDIAQGNPLSTTPIDRLYGVVKNAAMIANLGLKTTSELKHILNYSMTLKELGPEYAGKGIQTFLGNPLKTSERWKEITAMSPYMRQWAANWDRDISQAAKRLNIAGEPSLFGAESLWGRAMSVKTALTHDFSRMLFSLYGYAYMGIGGSAWEGAYMKVMDGVVEGLEKGDEKNAIAYADRTVRTTVAAGNTEDLPSIMRNKGMSKLFTWFYGPMNLIGNNVQKDWQKFSGSQKAPKDIAKFAGAEFLNILPAALLGSALGNELPKAKKLKDWVEWGAGAVGSELMGMAPILRDVPYAIKSRGHKFEDPFLDVLSSPLWSLYDLIGHAERGRHFSTSEVKNLGMTAGYFMELPSRQVIDSLVVAHDWLGAHRYHPDNVASGLWHVATGKEPRR